MLNKNTPGVKKVRGQSEAALQQGRRKHSRFGQENGPDTATLKAS